MKNNTYLIFGATRGIGLKFVEELINIEYSFIYLTYRDKKKLSNLKKLLKNTDNFRFIKCDVSKYKDLLSLKKIIVKNSNYKLNKIINFTSILGKGDSISNISLHQWKKVIQTNLNGAFMISKLFIPIIKGNENSILINFSGGGGTNPMPFFDAYAVTKAALVRLTENLSYAYDSKDICITSISPGGVNTDMFDDIFNQINRLPKKFQKPFLERKKKGGIKIDIPVKFIIDVLAQKDYSVFHGRNLSAVYDDIKKIIKNKNFIKKSNIYTLRRVDEMVLGKKYLK